ncbi:MAG TPA: hypothetical protein VLM05_15995, partial [Mycobacteriales bacterium]|nr:hypothetical protein [Mycobacteriales bacterium]
MRRADRGSAVVGFALVVVPVLVLVLVTVQAIAYLRLRDLVAAAAEQGARRGAAAGASTRDGAALADAVLAGSLPPAAHGTIHCTATETGGAGGAGPGGGGAAGGADSAGGVAAVDRAAGPVLVAVRCQ